MSAPTAPATATKPSDSESATADDWTIVSDDGASADPSQPPQASKPADPAAPSERDDKPSDGKTDPIPEVDLAFVMDTTGSMASYIDAATRSVEAICNTIMQSNSIAEGGLRVGLVAYRDHPPQDTTYVTKVWPLSSDVGAMHEHLASLGAHGGGDGPEAVTAALADLDGLDWRPDSAKLAVLIADAPPHGISASYYDGFPNGDPDGRDPLAIARDLAQRGVSLYMAACEPSLSQYGGAVDFFRGLIQITGGMVVPLNQAGLLADTIVAAAAETVDLERLHAELDEKVAAEIKRLHIQEVDALPPNEREKRRDAPPSQAVFALASHSVFQDLKQRKVTTRQVQFDNLYKDTEASKQNVETWVRAESVAAARPSLVPDPEDRSSGRLASGMAGTKCARMPHTRMFVGAAASVDPADKGDDVLAPVLASIPPVCSVSLMSADAGEHAAPAPPSKVESVAAGVTLAQVQRFTMQSHWRNAKSASAEKTA